ncbi:junctional cadherin 5-associated protein [Erpetoichthys calabaricus]|nr:junctional cadherin 5-associated protein [Erpetoichthys calabaricus]
MYSVEDLLISHGYKVPRTAASSNESRYADYHHEIKENRTSHGTANGYETDTGVYGCSRQVPAKGYFSDNESKEINQRRKAGSGNQGDARPPGDFHTTRTRVFDEPARVYSSQTKTERDVAYWRRRGQDFTILLDYTDSREPKANHFAERTSKDPGRHPMDEERERDWREDDGFLKQNDIVADKWRFTSDRKWQSLGTDEWTPAVGLGRPFLDNDGDRLAQGLFYQRCSDDAANVKIKGKSQSLPRVLSPENLQHVELSKDDVEQVFKGTSNTFPDGTASKEHYTENCKSLSHAALLPKPRFGRPLKPPSYETHQQLRNSSEFIAGTQDSKPKDTTVSNFAKSRETKSDIFAQDSAGSNLEPPVYVPPPSYKKPLQPKGNQKNFIEVPNPKERMEVQKVHVGKDTGKCPSWAEYQKDTDIPSRKQMYPFYKDEHLGCVQYIPFDDPRVKHLPPGSCENLLSNSTSKENLAGKIVGQSTQDSAFIIQAESQYIMPGKLLTSKNGKDIKWQNAIQKGNKDSALSDQSSVFYHKDPSSFGHSSRSAQHNQQQDIECSDTVTQLKKFEVEGKPENKNPRRKKNETIFCLVSMPVHSQPDNERTDQNNNKSNAEQNAAGKHLRNLQNQHLLSTSSTDLELQSLTGSMINYRGIRKPQSGPPEGNYKEVDELQPCQPNKHKELRYSGSWPGDQYKDQQTQTSFAERPKGAVMSQAQNPNHSIAPTKDNKSNPFNHYGYPMKGQTFLSPSSNSAFSWTTNFSNQVNKSSQQKSQSMENNLIDRKPTRGSKLEPKSPSSDGKEAFGQFLLKPVSRRPWDAIGELESFNKELQDQIWTQIESNELLENVDMAEEFTDSPTVNHKPADVQTEIPSQKQERSNVLRNSGKKGFSENGDPSRNPQKRPKFPNLGRPIKQDTPFPREPEYVDVDSVCWTSLEAATVRQLPQEVLSSTTNYNQIQKKQVSESTKEGGNGLDGHYSNGFMATECVYRLPAKISMNGLSELREKLGGPIGDDEETKQWIKNLTREDKYLEGLESSHASLIHPKALAAQSENLNELFEIKCAKGIPENETLEARAARILGIEVAVETLGVADQEYKDTEAEKLMATSETGGGKTTASVKDGLECDNWRSGYVSREAEELCSNEDEEDKENKITEGRNERATSWQTETSRATVSLKHLPGTGEQKACTTSVSERKSRVPSRMIEALQGKLATSPSRTVMERIVRMKEVDSVSRMRRLSIKSSDSGDEGENEKPAKQQQDVEDVLSFLNIQETLNNSSKRDGAVTRKTITLTQDLSVLTKRKVQRDDEDGVFISEWYDPSRVERV